MGPARCFGCTEPIEYGDVYIIGEDRRGHWPHSGLGVHEACIDAGILKYVKRLLAIGT